MIPFTIYFNVHSTVGLTVKDRTIDSRRLMQYSLVATINDAAGLEKIVRFHDVHNVKFREGKPFYNGFIETDCLTLDVDSGKSIPEFMEQNKEFCFVLYTSKSHNATHHRYHVVFPLGYSITSNSIYRELRYALEEMFPYSCKGFRITNCLFGNMNAEVFSNEGESIGERLQRFVDKRKRAEGEQPDVGKVVPEKASPLSSNADEILPRRGERFYGLGKKAQGILHGHASDYPYKSRSEAEAAVIMICIKNSWSYRQIEELFKSEAAANTHFREQKKNCYSYLKQTHQAMARYYRRSDFTERLDRFVDSYAFRGRTRYTDHAVSKAIVQIITETNKTEGLSLTLGELSNMTGIGLSTVAKSLKRLSEIWLTSEDGETGKRFSVRKDILAFLPTPTEKSDSGLRRLRNFGLDIFSNRGLGKTGKLIYECLLTFHVSSIPEIQKHTGIRSYNTVKKKVAKMQHVGMVQKFGKRWKLILNQLDENTEAQLARALGVSGILDRRHKDYMRQRENWKENRQRFKERKILESRWAKEQKTKDISGMVEIDEAQVNEKPA